MDDDFAGFEVTPLTWSPLLSFVSQDLPPPGALSMSTPCEQCGLVGDNMLCLGDNRVFCGRYANGCMAAHVTQDSVACKMALSFMDLSIWDYVQDAYLDMYNIGELQPHYAFLHQVKFGELPRVPEAPLLAGKPAPPLMGSRSGGAEDSSGFTLRLETLPPPPEAAAQTNSSSTRGSSSSEGATASESSFDVIVVGAGLVGSAAARHVLTIDPTLRVLLLGPAEGNNCGVAADENTADDGSGGGGACGSSGGTFKAPADVSTAAAPPPMKKNREEKAWHPSAARCHADEGRITRRLDSDPVWATLAARSIDRYASLEAESGVNFHSPCGFVACAANPTGAYADRMHQSAQAATAPSGNSPRAAVASEGTKAATKAPYIEELDVAAVAKRFPFLNLCQTTPSTSQVCDVDSDLGAADGLQAESSSGHHPRGSGQPLLEAAKARAWAEPSASAGGRTGAGWVSARKLLEAQQAVFQRCGGTWLREGVDKVEPRMLDETARGSCCCGSSDSGSGSGGNSEKRDSLKMFKVCTASGKELLAKRVLIATNTATNFRQLLPLPLALTLRTQTTCRLVLSPEEAAGLRDMPSLVLKWDALGAPPVGTASIPGPLVRHDDRLYFLDDSCYILPPVWYPNGEGWAVKMGHGKAFEQTLSTEAELREWYEGSEGADANARQALEAALRNLLPSAGPGARAVFDRCCTPNTFHGRPYIDTFPVNWTPPSTTAMTSSDEMHERSDSESTKHGPVLACAVGCNGYAAKASDEVGRLAARLLLFSGGPNAAEWADGLDSDSFKAVHA